MSDDDDSSAGVLRVDIGDDLFDVAVETRSARGDGGGDQGHVHGRGNRLPCKLRALILRGEHGCHAGVLQGSGEGVRARDTGLTQYRIGGAAGNGFGVADDDDRRDGRRG